MFSYSETPLQTPQDFEVALGLTRSMSFKPSALWHREDGRFLHQADFMGLPGHWIAQPSTGLFCFQAVFCDHPGDGATFTLDPFDVARTGYTRFREYLVDRGWDAFDANGRPPARQGCQVEALWYERYGHFRAVRRTWGRRRTGTASMSEVAIIGSAQDSEIAEFGADRFRSRND